MVRNPHDLGAIYIVDSHDAGKPPIKIPACEAHREYATGLTKHNHEVVKANAAAERKKVDFSDLVATKAALSTIAAALRNHPSRAKTERTLARYLDSEITRRLRTQVRTNVAPGSDYLQAAPKAPRTSNALGVAAEPKTWSQDEDDDDLELIKQGKEYDAYVED